jgi:hypothetical protein
MLFVLIVSSKEARSGVEGNPVMTQAGDRFVVVVEPEGWVEATSRSYDANNVISPDAKIFRTVSGAAKFARRWKGHPWYCIPDGNFEVVPVQRITRSEKHTVGFRRAVNISEV